MEARVTSRGRVVIPVALRRKYGVKNGTRIVFRNEDEQIVLVPVTEKYVRSLRGMLKGNTGMKMLMEDRLADSNS